MPLAPSELRPAAENRLAQEVTGSGLPPLFHNGFV